LPLTLSMCTNKRKRQNNNNSSGQRHLH
jgi:hypothetical protein